MKTARRSRAKKGWGSGGPAPRPFRSGVYAVLAPRSGNPSQEGMGVGWPRPPSLPLRGLRGACAPLRKPEPRRDGGRVAPPPSLPLRGLRGACAPLRKPEPRRDGGRVAPPPSLPLRGLRGACAPLRKPEPRRDGGRVAPPPVPSAPGSTRCLRPAPETRAKKGWGSGGPAPRPFRSGVYAVLAPRSGNERRCIPAAPLRSSLRFGRNTPGPVLPVGAPPSRALSAGRLAPTGRTAALGAHADFATGC